MPSKTADIIATLQSDILRMQGHRPANNGAIDFSLGPIMNSFPGKTFPLGAVHEFLSSKSEDAAATGGFIAGLLAPLMGNNGTTLWISSSRTIYPPALKNFGIQPDRIVFIDLEKESDVIRAMDDALKCSALAAVVGEMHDLTFTSSRRLQLAVEQSQVTGFILRQDSRAVKTTACVTRWKITSLPSITFDALPGVGYPQWKVELLRIKNGKCGSWNVRWRKGRFELADDLVVDRNISTGTNGDHQRKTG